MADNLIRKPAIRDRRIATGLLAAFVVVWTLLALQPNSRADWLLENSLVHGYRKLPLSNASYILAFVFLCLHEVGAHYTYAQVPFGWGWIGSLRNNYDRVVHFSFGLLLIPMVVDLFNARARLVGMWRYFVPVTFIMAFSEGFEMIEWQVARIFGGPLGQAYLGAQGDIWDAQKDSGLAMLGAILSMTLLAGITRRRSWGLPTP